MTIETKPDINTLGVITPFTELLFKKSNRIALNGAEAMGTTTIRGVINMLAGRGSKHLEIGIYRGASLVAAAHGNPNTTCIGIDNFSMFNGDNTNELVARERISPYPNASIIKADCWEILESFDKLRVKVDSCFYDGPHEYTDQLRALRLLSRLITRGGYILVDDINRNPVYQASCDFLEEHPEFQCVLCKFTDKVHSRDAIWWDGFQVFQKS